MYNVEKDEWVATIPSLGGSRHDCCCVGAGNYIFVYGGRYSMGRFRDIISLKIDFTEDGTI